MEETAPEGFTTPFTAVQLSRRAEAKTAVTGIGGAAGGILHNEKAIALNGDVEGASGGLHRALSETAGGESAADAGADLQGRGGGVHGVLEKH